MEKFKGYLFVFLGCLACFTYGAYLYGYLNYDVVVKPHQWILTGFFGLFFMALGINHFIEKAVENMRDKILDQRFKHTVDVSYETDLIDELINMIEHPENSNQEWKDIIIKSARDKGYGKRTRVEEV